MKNPVTKLLATAALATCLTGTSCIGPNHAYNSLASWNSELTDSKYLNELVFLGLNWVPAYPLCLMGDYIIFNSVEFWTGENPIDAPKDFKAQSDLK